MKKILLTLFLLFGSITTAQNFFPTKAGDAYQLLEWYEYWLDPTQNHESFSKSLATEITFNNKTYVSAWDNYYHMDTTANKLFILLNNEEKLAFDFNKPDGDTDTLYFNGYARLYTYSTIQNWNIFGEDRVVKKIANINSEGWIEWFLANEIGIYKCNFRNQLGYFDITTHVISVILDDSVYNPINLGLTAFLPSRVSRTQSSFSFFVNIETEYFGLVDTLDAHVLVYKADSLLYQQTYNGSISLEKITVNIPQQIYSQADSVGIRVRCTDKSILNNQVFYPHSGYKYIPIEDEVEWNLLTPSITGPNYMGMKFFSVNRGYVFTYGGTYPYLYYYNNLTTNGGISFPSVSNPNWSYWKITDIISFNENTAYMIMDVLRKTTDQGTTWENVLSPGDEAAMSFLDKDTGWVSHSYQPKVFRTYDGGLSWTTFNTNLQAAFGLIDFVQINDGYTVTDLGKVYRSTDGGETWQFINTTLAYQKKLEMFPEGKGWLIGNGIWRTEDGGINWTQQFAGSFVDAHFFSKDKGWVIGSVNGSKALLHTIDGGYNWTQVDAQANGNAFLNIDFVDESYGWIFTSSRELLRTTNGGVTFIEEEENNLAQPKQFLLQQNYPNPFNPSTTISYQLPKAGNVTLKVFDVLGREVATLVDEYRNAGSYNVQFTINNLQLSSGIYFYQLKSGDYFETKKMLLIK